MPDAKPGDAPTRPNSRELIRELIGTVDLHSTTAVEELLVLNRAFNAASASSLNGERETTSLDSGGHD
jgi:hypothetical protein